MQHFMVQGLDGTDAGAHDRRMNARQEHLEVVKQLYDAGKLIYGAALLDENNAMCGSVMIVAFEDEAQLRKQWLDTEPYVTAGVWENYSIRPCKAPTIFA